MAIKPLKITVYGGTGNIGQRIVAEALGRGHLVRAVARNPERVEVAGTGLAVASGDVLDTALVTRQLRGQDVVISAVNVGRGADSQGEDFLRRAAESLVTALRTLGARAPRLIVVGGAGTLEVAPGLTLLEQMVQQGRPANGGPWQQKMALDYYREVRDVNWTYLSPAMEITPGQRTGQYRVGGDALLRDAAGNSRISIEDYAMAVIDEAEIPKHPQQRFTVAY